MVQGSYQDRYTNNRLAAPFNPLDRIYGVADVGTETLAGARGLDLLQARGNTVYSTGDWCIGDGVTDDTANFNAMLTAAFAASEQPTIYIPNTVRITSTISLTKTAVFIGENLRDSQIIYDSAASNTALFKCINTVSPFFENFTTINAKFVCAQGATVANQSFVQIGETGVGVGKMDEPRFLTTRFQTFSGAIFYIEHNNDESNFGSSGRFSNCIIDGAGAFLKTDGTKVGSVALGTNFLIDNLHVKGSGWMPISPHTHFFDFEDLREVEILNSTFEGTGPGVSQTGIIRFTGDTWLTIDNMHLELTNSWPTYSLDMETGINASAQRRVNLRNVRAFIQGMKIRVCDKAKIVLDQVTGTQPGELSSDLIDESNSTSGQWFVNMRNMGNYPNIIPRHIGHIVADGAGAENNQTQFNMNGGTILEYDPARDGLMTGLISAGLVNNNRMASGLAEFFFESGTITEFGMRHDTERGRVFYVKGTGAAPAHRINYLLPSEFLESGGLRGCQVSVAMEWKMVYAGTPFRYLLFNPQGTAEDTLSNNSDTTLTTDQWLMAQWTGYCAGVSAPSLRTSGSGTPDAEWELRIASLKVSLGPNTPRIANPGALVTATANQRRPLVMSNDSAPTVGDWYAGDTVLNRNKASGQPIDWGCSVDGAPGTWVAGPSRP